MLQLFYPVKNPINKTNLFGTPSPTYTRLGQKGHPGLDFMSPSGTPLYCPCDGLAFYVTDKQGGDGIWIRVTTEGKNYNIILWHLYEKSNKFFPFQIPTDGSKNLVKAGQFLGYTDNSGFPNESSGPHLHLGVMPCDSNWAPISPNNGYLSCVDPMPFFNGKYAQDIDIQAEIVQKVEQVTNLLPKADLPPAITMSIWRKVAELVKKFLNK